MTDTGSDWDSILPESPLQSSDTSIDDNASNDDVAVVGMACRVAGDNNSPEDLWETIVNQTDNSGEIPSMRWEPYLRRDPRNAKAIKETTSRGYFLENLDAFDATFFGISPKEAVQMDPQQRISLEVAWEALEDAGIPPQSLSGSDTAVFMGVNSDDYAKLVLEDLPNVEAWMGIGTAYCGVPNRISYHLNLMGPSTAVDAACASSLVAIHHGRQAILMGESKIAIVGGVNALIGPGLTSVLDKAGATCPEGNCLSFDDSAHGYGRGEGVAVVILKRFNDAVRDGDNIIATLKGSAVGQDGHTNGIMAPNAKAQAMVAQTALRCANIDPLTVEYVECHATSTPLGDPTEVSAVSKVYGSGRPRDRPLNIGSVKPNVGHLEAGAGAIGFIKACLAVEKGLLPPQANLKKLNSKINWEESGVKVVQSLSEWSKHNQLRRAGICSYGYGGTVSHAIIEQYPSQQSLFSPVKKMDKHAHVGPQIIVVTAPQERRIAAQAEVQSSWMKEHGNKYDFRTIAATTGVRREHHPHRVAFVVDNQADAIGALDSFANGTINVWGAKGRVFGNDVSKDVVWVFSGHGAQWENMGLELLHNYTFYKALADLDPIVKAEAGFSAIQALETGDFEASDKVQVLTYVMQIGLAAVLRSRGLHPQAIIGHSVGEIAASVVAGCLTPVEGCLIVTRRAKLYRQVQGEGSMILVNLPFTELQTDLGTRTDLVAAIDSSPSSCVVSGEAKAVAEYADALRIRGVKSFNVKTDIAFHSPTLEKLVKPLEDALANSLSPRQPSVPLYSTSDPDPRSNTIRDIAYWTRNMVYPVKLTSAVGAAIEDGKRMFMEVSTHPIVAHSINETIMDHGCEDYVVVPTLLRNKPSEKRILFSIAQLFVRGVDIDFRRQQGKNWVPSFPGTKWMHKHIWRQVETGLVTSVHNHDVDKHTLLGEHNPVADTNTVLFTTRLDNDNKPFPGSHPLHGTEIVPAAALCNTFYHATGCEALHNVVLRVPVAINAPRDVQVVIHEQHIKIYSRLARAEGDLSGDETLFATHTTADWSAKRPETPEAEAIKFDLEVLKRSIETRLPDNFSMDYLDKVGVSAMGYPWMITEHYGTLREMIAKVDVCPSLEEGKELPWDKYSWAPLLDAATSVGSTIFFSDPKLRMPSQIDGVYWYTDIPPRHAYLYVEEASDIGPAVHVSVLSEEGDMVCKFQSMRFAEIEGTPGASGGMESLVHQLAWPPAHFSEKPHHFKHVIMVSENIHLRESYEKSFRKQACTVSRIDTADLLNGKEFVEKLNDKDSIVVYVPEQVEALSDVSTAGQRFISETLSIAKLLINEKYACKMYVLTDEVCLGESTTALAQAPLQGLCRIIASEHPDIWGAMIDTEDGNFPLMAMKFVVGQDIVRMQDGMPRAARLRPVPRDLMKAADDKQSLLPRPEGTYLVTGGIGALGLEVAEFLVEKGARRIVLVSRRTIPPRSKWNNATNQFYLTAQRIVALEKKGATVAFLSVDIGAPSAQADLESALDKLNFPPVLGVVHAAGVLEDQLVLETTAESFANVLSPKVSGAIALHKAFPPTTIDFFILFSSCGQLFGFPGQSAYAAGNAFLDTLATHRRGQGDNAVAFQWTSWRSMGMAASSDFITAELQSKGITDITKDEAFHAWEHLNQFNTDHAVVLRSLTFDEGEQLPVDLLQDIAVRRVGTGNETASEAATSTLSSAELVPSSGPELKTYIERKIRECVAAVLQMSGIEEVDPRAPITDLGVDSVMTVTLRRQLQTALKIKVPPTLTWSHPTVNHLVGWFVEKWQS